MSSDKKSMSKQELLALGLMNTLPALLGAAIAGPEAGAGGAAASQQGNQVLMDFAKADREEEQNAELAKETALAKAEESEKDRQLKRDIAQLSAGQRAPQLTKGQEALDRQFAKTYEDFAAQGGKAGLDRKLESLEDVKQQLSKTDSASGPLIGLLPKGVRDVITPGGAAIQDRVEQVVQESLRQTLGAQFTEKEAQRLIERAYNPRLSEEENIKRLDSVLKEIRSRGESTQRASDYFEDKGTLTGFKAGEGQSSTEAPQMSPKDRLEFLRKKHGRK